MALIAYYTGLFLSPCCLVGLPLGFGIQGPRERKRKPAMDGSVHAWVGIVLGGISVIMTVVAWIILSRRFSPRGDRGGLRTRSP